MMSCWPCEAGCQVVVVGGLLAAYLGQQVHDKIGEGRRSQTAIEEMAVPCLSPLFLYQSFNASNKDIMRIPTSSTNEMSLILPNV